MGALVKQITSPGHECSFVIDNDNNMDNHSHRYQFDTAFLGKNGSSNLIEIVEILLSIWLCEFISLLKCNPIIWKYR